MEEKKQDQAADLREIIENNNDNNKSQDVPEIDVLNLPPRSEIHQGNGRTRIKMNKPFLRFLFVILLIIIIIIGTQYFSVIKL